MPVSSKKSQSSFVRLGCRLATSLLLSSTVVSSFEGFFLTQSAQAAPTRKDWCGTVWSVENQNTLAWINPVTGVTTAASGPTTQITMPGGSMGTAVAAIGIHKESGTMFAFDRNGTTGTLYKYKFGVDTAWTSVSVSGLLGLSGTQSIAGASNNLNKMTVDGNTLLIAESNGVAVYAIPLNSSGAVMGGATSTVYNYSGDPGTYNHLSAVNDPVLYPVGTEFINGGDLTTDEYGDVYNITYNAVVTGYPIVNNVRQQTLQTTKAYFYKKSGTTWIYQGETSAAVNFAGAAFYKGDLFVKAALQFKKVDLTRSGSGYTGWNSPLANIGAANGVGAGSADLTACGTPNVVVTKNQQIYTDAAATTVSADQTKVKPGEYIKYTVTAKNTGDTWARSTSLTDNLPIGTSYVPNSATLNGVNLGLVAYPSTGFALNSPSSVTGIIPFLPDPDTATLTFLVQVTAIAGAVQNLATVAYVDSSGLPSEPPICTTGVNCGTSTSLPVDSVANQPPNTVDINATSQVNPGGATTLQVPPLSGNDPEDGVLGTGKTFKIITLPTNATLFYNGTAITTPNFTIANYDPTKLTIDPNDGALTVSFTYAAVDAAGQSDASPATVTMPFTTAPVIPNICSVAGGIRGTNLFANDGNFGTGSSTPSTSTPLPPGRTTYNFQNYGLLSPTDGNYAIVNQLNKNTFTGNWHNTFGHTTGTVNDQMMVVNAAFTPGTFYTEMLTVPANQNIEFSAWILNLINAKSQIKPNVSFVINRIGVDDNNNGTVDELGEGQVVTNSGPIPESTTPTWLNYGAIINTGNATQIEYRLVNNALGGNGNDLVLDDLFAAPCSPMPQGNITGTLYRDTNTNNLYNSGTDTTMPANIAVNLKSATGVIVATAYTDASGNYSFINVPAGSNYRLEVALTDSDIPIGAIPTANPTGASNTGIQTGITIADGVTLANQNFGFLPTKPQVLLVKRITAINGGTSTDAGNSLAGYINALTNPYDDNTITIPTQPTLTDPPKDTDKWPTLNTFMLGGIDGGHINPGDQLEYTIYFLSSGDATASNVLFCDRVPSNVSFIPTAFNSATPATGGLAGDRGILSLLNGTTAAFTNIADGDAARYFPPNSDPTAVYPNLNCGGANTNGAVVINLGDLPNATTPGTPAGAFGFVRFKGRVK